MRKAQAIGHFILGLVFVVALIGMYFIFTQGAMFGRAGESELRVWVGVGETENVDGVTITVESADRTELEFVVDGVASGPAQYSRYYNLGGVSIKPVSYSSSRQSVKFKVKLLSPAVEAPVLVPVVPVVVLTVTEKGLLNQNNEFVEGLKVQRGDTVRFLSSLEGVVDVEAPPGVACAGAKLQSGGSLDCLFPKIGSYKIGIGKLVFIASVLTACHPFERQCLTATAGQICDLQGVWQPLACPENTFCSESKETKVCVECRTDTDCPAGKNCKAWQCISPQVCNSFERQCLTATAGQICNLKGTGWDSFDCLPGTVCSVAKDTKPCVPLCNSFERQCTTITAGQICNLEGTGWNSFDCAPEGKICSAKPGTKPCIAPPPVLMPAIPQ